VSAGRWITRLAAPAKLTRSLRVIGARSDGYHLIEAEMVSIDLADHLELRVGDGLEALDGAGDPMPDLGPHDQNLVSRALRLAGRRAHVRIHKRIPAGAGLGGGSSDAAAILRWAGFTDVERAAGIGADVAFCLVGGRAAVSGVGERVRRLEPVDLTFTLLTPDLHCDTPSVYRRWDGLGGPVGDNGNDLEPAAVDLYPRLAEARDRLGDLTGIRPRLAGSGATWFVEGEWDVPGGVVARTWSPRATCRVPDADAVCDEAACGASSSSSACGAS